MELLTLDDLRRLPDASEGRSGVYFLWLGEDLQYIGQSMVIGTRIGQHQQNYLYGPLRSTPVTRIKFDSGTMIELSTLRYFEEMEDLRKLRKLILETEVAYVNAYRTPFNNWPHRATNVELARI